MVIANYATGASVVADALVFHVLGMCTDWTAVQSVRQRLVGIARASVDKVVASMIEQRLLVRSTDKPDPRERALDAWQDWNPAAGFFHFSTKNMAPPANREQTERALRAEAAERGIPPPIKRYPKAATVRLPPPSTDGAFPEVLLDRRTWRSFGTQPVSLADISTLAQFDMGRAAYRRQRRTRPRAVEDVALIRRPPAARGLHARAPGRWARARPVSLSR